MKANYTIKNFAKRVVMMLTAILMVGSAFGATYFEDTFSNIGNSDNQSITSRSGWGSFTKCYSQGNSGMRIGSGSATGSVTKTAMTGIVGTKNIKVTIYVSKYNTQNATLTITAANGTISAISGVGSLSAGTITITPSANAGVNSTTAAATWTDSYKTEFTITGASSSTTITFGTSRRLVLGPVKIEDAAASTFTVTINRNNTSYGTVSQSSVTSVANNTSISADGAVLTVGSTPVTATPHAQDADYNYAFSNWSGIPAGGKVTADVTVTANFTRTARTLTNYRTSCASTFDIVLHDNNGGSHNGSATVAVNGTTLTNITPPTRSGFVVEGYYDDDSYSHKVAASDGTLQPNVTGYTGAGGAWTKGSGATLYAKWTASYTVTYNANGGDGTMTDSNSPYASGSTVTVLGNSFTAPTGKEFDHWNTRRQTTAVQLMHRMLRLPFLLTQYCMLNGEMSIIM